MNSITQFVQNTDVLVIAPYGVGKPLANLIAHEVPAGVFISDQPEVALHLLNLATRPPCAIFFEQTVSGVNVLERLAWFKYARKRRKLPAPMLILLGPRPHFCWFRRNFCLLDSTLVFPFTTRRLRRLVKKCTRSLSNSQGDFHA